MESDLMANWPWIVKLFDNAYRSSRFYSFASTNPDGSAHVAPYASLILNDDCTGYYSDVFPNRMSRNLAKDDRVCIMAIDTGIWSWFKALFSGRFSRHPGVRLYGIVGKSRPAKFGEVERWQKKVERFKRMKGYDLLWKDIKSVRDITFTRFEPIHLDKMTGHLASEQGG